MNSDVHNNKKLDLYKNIKSDLQCEKYLLSITSPYLRSTMSKFRCSDHKLRIETGGHEGINVALRVFKNCLEKGHTYMDEDF